jgi:superfamily II DNA or RNA helicase
VRRLGHDSVRLVPGALIDDRSVLAGIPQAGRQCLAGRCGMTIQLRGYQRNAIDAIYSYFMTACGHPLVVVPTAGGKSLVMAAFIQEVLAQWPDERIIILTHVRELISQNFAELIRLWPEAPAGIYSAGLNRRDVQAPILFAGIQSVYRKAYAIQRADLVLVDEAHLIPRSANTTYRRFLGDLTRINPQLKIIGLTATPYRLDSGMLHTGGDALFDDIAFEVSVRELIDEGYLAPLISKQTTTQLDVSGVAQPCCCVHATSVPEPFWAALQEGSMVDGSLARFLVFQTHDDVPDRNRRPKPIGDVPDKLVQALQAVVAGVPGHGRPEDLRFEISSVMIT